MKYYISNELVNLYKNSGKNLNYSLDYILSSLDSNVCKKAIELVAEVNIRGEKVAVDIDETNICEIKAIFNSNDNSLVEKLLWIAILFPEI